MKPYFRDHVGWGFVCRCLSFSVRLYQSATIARSCSSISTNEAAGCLLTFSWRCWDCVKAELHHRNGWFKEQECVWCSCHQIRHQIKAPRGKGQPIMCIKYVRIWTWINTDMPFAQTKHPSSCNYLSVCSNCVLPPPPFILPDNRLHIWDTVSPGALSGLFGWQGRRWRGKKRRSIRQAIENWRHVINHLGRMKSIFCKWTAQLKRW